MVGGFGRVRAVWGRLARAAVVAALVGAATIAGATAAQAEPPPWGSPYTPHDGVCTGAQSDADCWHYVDTYRTPEDCRNAGLSYTFGYAGSTECTTSGRAGNTDLWIWMPDGDCVSGATADQCRGGLRTPTWSVWPLPTPVGS